MAKAIIDCTALVERTAKVQVPWHASVVTDKIQRRRRRDREGARRGDPPRRSTATGQLRNERPLRGSRMEQPATEYCTLRMERWYGQFCGARELECARQQREFASAQ